MTTSCDVLRQKKCVPCEGGVPTIQPDQAAAMMEAVPEWTLDDSAKMISRKINAGNFVKAVALIDRIAELAESEGHHPDLHLTGYRNLRIDLTTHAIGGLSENDFIVAAKVDALIG
ncbi:4a-hydroxytetrahydrobiopterin dehydratase [Rubripirellula amarantea]|nr:4a-hydroxytetrahydrobiopterin dehydratase [Rubripirellula amarantea]MDA8744598.1 4a-hydroxytetrahydrobiopterin dehydratase [Rubripirellula amarantea]